MLLVIFSEALGAGETFAEKHHYRIDPNQEMIALGVANIGSGLLGGLAGGGSLSQTAVNDGAGARSEASSIVAAALSLVTVVALTPLFKDLPEAVLAALIIHAVSGLMRVGEMRTFYRLVPREFWLGMLTLGGVIILDVLPGLIIGVGASLLLLIYRASRPRISVLGHDPTNADTFLDADRHPAAVPTPGVLVVRPDSPLFYANAQTLRDTIEASIQSTAEPVHTVIIDLDANDEIDITSSDTLNKLAQSLERQEIRLGLSHVHQPAINIARRSGLLAQIGDDHIFPNVSTALTWALKNESPS
jgi:MFS superfamily sulfate permease-like transporter